MQRRKHMMTKEKSISVLFRQQQSGLSIADLYAYRDDVW